jgi:hypothetical protein
MLSGWFPEIIHIAAKRVINLGNFKRDFVLRINQWDHLKPQLDIFVTDSRSNRGAAAVINYATCSSSCEITQRTLRHRDTLTTGNDGPLVVCSVDCRARQDFKVAPRVQCSNKDGNGIADRTVNGQPRQSRKSSRHEKPSRVSDDSPIGRDDPGGIQVSRGDTAASADLLESLRPVDAELKNCW